jgi:3',5'-cyclic AMP phosphodiesterase CpdA
MHHPPILTGSPVWDDLGLPLADRLALRDVLARHAQVRRVVAGHVHRTMTGELGGAPVLTVPSTYVQARLNFDSQELELTPDPAGFGVHVVVDGELTSHVEPVT